MRTIFVASRLRLAFFVLLALVSFFSWVIYLILVDKLPRKIEIFVVEEYIEADIVVATDVSIGEMFPVWQAFAQGGEEAGGMLEGTEALMSETRPQYIRLDHIFDDDYYGVVRRDGGNLRADWSKLDVAVDSIMEMGAKPFLALGYMPSEIAPSKIDQPNNWAEWQWLVEETIRHYSGINGKNIDGVYYEVWNEPDLESFGYWKYFGDKSYITLYEWSARGAQAVRDGGGVNDFKIGGPGITALYKNWVVALANFTQANNLPLDFISWHRYDYYPSRFERDIADIERWINDERAEGRDLEWIISEWGPDPGKTPVYSGRYSAAHAVAVARRMIDGLDWGFAFEVKDGPNQEDYGWGVLTHQLAGLSPKPRFYAFSMMSEMAGNRIELTGEGSNVVGWAVAADDGNVNVLLTNFHPEGAEVEDVPISYTGLESGQYRLTWQSLTGSNGEDIYVVDGLSSELATSIQVDVNDVVILKLSQIEAYKKIRAPQAAEEAPVVIIPIGGRSAFDILQERRIFQEAFAPGQGEEDSEGAVSDPSGGSGASVGSGTSGSERDIYVEISGTGFGQVLLEGKE